MCLNVVWQLKFVLGSLAFFGTFYFAWQLIFKRVIRPSYGMKSACQLSAAMFCEHIVTANWCREFRELLFKSLRYFFTF